MSWLKRPYEPRDEDAIVYLWLKSFSGSRYGSSVDASAARSIYDLEAIKAGEYRRHHGRFHEDDSALVSTAERARADASEMAYWARHRLIVMRLIETATIEVLCDPQDTSIIWAFACTEPWVVHMCVVKRRFKELRKMMVVGLIADHLRSACRFTHEMPDLKATFIDAPDGWVFDPYLLAVDR